MCSSSPIVVDAVYKTHRYKIHSLIRLKSRAFDSFSFDSYIILFDLVTPYTTVPQYSRFCNVPFSKFNAQNSDPHVVAGVITVL